MLFWMLCAALTAGVIAALARPLLAPPADRESDAPDLEVYRDQLREIDRDVARGLLTEAEAQSSKVEVSRRMLTAVEGDGPGSSPAVPGHDRAARAMLYAIAGGIPVLALSFYLALGSPGLPGAPAGERLAGASAATAKVAALVAQIEARLREHPGDGRGWDVIAPVYMNLGRYRDAADAYARAIELEGETAARLSGFAEATVAASNDVVTEPARKAFEKVLLLEPARLEPRFWLTLAKEQDGNLAGAEAGYRALLAGMPADTPWRPLVEERLEAASGRLRRQAKDAGAGPGADDIAAASQLPPDQRAAMIARMVEGLASRLAANGKDLAGWQRLLRSYTVLGQIDKAERALVDARQALAGDGPALSELNAYARRLGLKS
jgi:cytochrome c-type biogenesis protein CcmH